MNTAEMIEFKSVRNWPNDQLVRDTVGFQFPTLTPTFADGRVRFAACDAEPPARPESWIRLRVFANAQPIEEPFCQRTQRVFSPHQRNGSFAKTGTRTESRSLASVAFDQEDRPALLARTFNALTRVQLNASTGVGTEANAVCHTSGANIEDVPAM